MAFVIDNDIKDRVRSATDIVDLLGSYMQLRRQGANFVGLCPFHDDRRPSLQINVTRQSWKCWVCDLGGDVFSFLMQKEQLSFSEALSMLAERAGIELPKSPGAKLAADNRQELLATMKWVVEQYRNCFLHEPIAAAARQYVVERGIDEQSSDAYQIGFAPSEWNWLTDRFVATGKPLSLLNEVGVTGKSDRGSIYDRFRGRLIFPIADAQGRYISLGGRLMPGELDGQAKYVNCSETRLYQKNQQLYGLNLARSSITQSRTAVVMEGYTDVIMSNQFGIPNAVAVCGTAMGENHLRLLKRYCEQIILVLDGDAAGRRRANEILDLFLGHSIDLRVVTLPEELDPCDFLLKYGGDPLREIISNAIDALEFKVAELLGGVDPYEDTHRANSAVEQIISLLARSATRANSADGFALRQEQMLLRLSKRFGVDVALLRTRLNEHQKQANVRAKARNIVNKAFAGKSETVDELKSEPNSSDIRRIVPTSQIHYKDMTAIERELFEILVARADLVPLALEQFDERILTSPPGQALMQVYVECDFRGLDLDYDSVMAALEDAQLKSLLVSIENAATAKSAKIQIDARERLLSLCDSMSRADLDAQQLRRVKMLESPDLDDIEQLRLLQDVVQSARENKSLRIPGI